AIYLALAAYYFTGDARARVLGLAVATSSLIGAQALRACGMLVDWGGWRAPFGLYLVAVPVLIVAWFAIHPARHDAAHRPSPGLGALTEALATYWPIYAVLMVMSVGTFVLSEGGPFLLRANGFTSAAVIGGILSIGYYPSVITAASYGFVRKYVSDRMIL